MNYNCIVNRLGNSGIGKWIKGHFRSLIAILIVGFPFAVDFLYGNGFLRKIRHAFPADVWFSFIGSYFPAMIIGYITLYQAHIIREKDRQYQELLYQRRFLSAGRALIYRYSKEAGKIAEYRAQDLGILWRGDNATNPPKNWDDGYLIELRFFDLTEQMINCIQFEKLVWKINDKEYELTDANRTALEWHRETDRTYSITLFCVYPDDSEIGDEALRCMRHIRDQTLRYMSSSLTLDLIIEQGTGGKYQMKACFQMKAQENTHYLISRTESFSCTELK